MIITIMRHGETKYNLIQKIQGRIDVPLNRTGIKQAKDKGKELSEKGIKFDVIFASPLKRALKTAYLVAKELKYEGDIYQSDAFLERDFGSLDGKYYHEAKVYYQNDDYDHPSFEDDDMLIKRVVDGVVNIEKVFPDKHVLIVAHSHVIKALLVYSEPETFNFKKGFIGHTETITFSLKNGVIKRCL